MDVADLQIFIETLQRGSFAAVARERNIDPSSVSRVIAALEDELELRLFHRTTRRLTLTEAGAVYFDRIEPLVEELVRAQLQAADVGRVPGGTLRIAAPVSFAELNVIPLLPELSRRYPQLSFDLLLTDAALDLAEERIDVALILAARLPTGLAGEPLAPMVGRVCASPGYLEQHGRPATPDELARHTCLTLNMPGFGNRWRFQSAAGQRQDVTVSGTLKTSNAVALKLCALAGMGIILQARWIVGRELRGGQLIDLFPEHEVTAASAKTPAIWLAYPERQYQPLKVQVFVQALRAAFERGSPWDQASPHLD